ncbi:SDR family NAD(P)-dependent oxidoreductase [Niallia endozanthoxylica]|uniref:SDR family oxidoreductase n=1 Tax=Niallia endozanthoxylica TaxID=2036016 RepID=A0A5J5HRL4_9BACI|nr:SDR family oxidoreductase [Niallia endozanthoxylica]KAA9022555.1 SDR family oxidoreductase [Niallia endozanthoxylica]
MDIDLKGKNVLITGAAKGIGRGMALAAAGEGANIALHYLGSEEAAARTANEIKEAYSVEVHLVKGDLAKIEDVTKIKDELDHRLGGIDCIVNNAGFSQMKSFFQYKPEEWKQEVDVCFYGVLNLVHTFMPEMIDKRKGKFVNIVGDSARTGDKHLIISAAARNGSISFLKSLAQEVGKSNVQCNTVSFGLINHGSLDFNEAALEKIAKQYPLKRLGKVEDVTGIILFLLSNHADWITGQVISVNGGHSMLG